MTELFLKIIGIILIAAVAAVLLKGYRGEFAFLVSVSACVVVLLLVLNAVSPFIDYLRELFYAGDMDLSYFSVVLKALAISYISSFAAAIAMYAEFDLGAVARRIAASARGMRASGSPSWSAESTRLFTITLAIGQARPISSLAITRSLRQGEIRSPPSRSFAR